jgi:hypothetical protein
MAPAEAVRRLGDILRTLEAGGVRVPESIQRVACEEEVTEDELRTAAADAAEIAREQGDEEAAQVAEFVSSYRGADFADKLQELLATVWEKAGGRTITQQMVAALIAGCLIFVIFPQEPTTEVHIDDVDIYVTEPQPDPPRDRDEAGEPAGPPEEERARGKRERDPPREKRAPAPQEAAPPPPDREPRSGHEE